MARSSAVTAGALTVGAVPSVRRMPACTARTTGSPVGLGWPAALCAWEMDDSRRCRVAGLATRARSDRYKAMVSASAGTAVRSWSWHQAVNWAAFCEGWGLYAERLAENMGLYRDDLDRLGMLSADSLR